MHCTHKCSHKTHLECKPCCCHTGSSGSSWRGAGRASTGCAGWEGAGTVPFRAPCPEQPLTGAPAHSSRWEWSPEGSAHSRWDPSTEAAGLCECRIPGPGSPASAPALPCASSHCHPACSSGSRNPLTARAAFNYSRYHPLRSAIENLS